MFSDQLADNYVINTDFSNIPSNINEYDGVADEFHFNQNGLIMNQMAMKIQFIHLLISE